MVKNKMNAILFMIIMILAVFTASACSSNTDEKVKQSNETSDTVRTITTEDLKKNLNDDSWVIVDTRINDAFNGWKLDGVARGGHIEGAADFSANWLNVDVEDKEKKLEETLKAKGISSDKNIILYDANGIDAKKVEKYLSEKGYKNLYTYDVNKWAEDESLPMVQYKNYQRIVPASVVKDVLDGKTPETFEEGKKVKIVEASWGEEKESYAKGHVPTSFHINTDTVEPPPEWMLASDEKLSQFALDNGFTKDDSVIVTSESQMAAYRVAAVLSYIGVEDVRVLNGGLSAWTGAGYEVETTSNKPEPVSDFGTTIPANPDLIDTQDELKSVILANPDKATLVDNRTWEEYIGETSGYSYHDKAGRIPGAILDMPEKLTQTH